jgi:hypothetical protein
MIQIIVIGILLFAASIFTDANADTIDLPNLKRPATGTNLGGGKYALDVSLPPGAVTVEGSKTIGEPNAVNDKGLTVLGVRKDSPGPLTGVADGDYTPFLVDSNGDLRVFTTNPANGANGSPAPSVGTMVGGYDGTNLRYLSTDTNGVLKVDVKGKTQVLDSRNDYSGTPVNTTSWTQLIASTPQAISEVEIFDSSGQTMELGIGPPSSETRILYISPGGNGRVPLIIPAGSRISIRAVSGNATVGENLINFYN